ncbi:hypothetical protein EI94DRAFT_578970 [Lactarius quietus]|nr:hypothetical protein EI94DRAFT_578970 [Lactarius quietus]
MGVISIGGSHLMRRDSGLSRVVNPTGFATRNRNAEGTGAVTYDHNHQPLCHHFIFAFSFFFCSLSRALSLRATILQTILHHPMRRPPSLSQVRSPSLCLHPRPATLPEIRQVAILRQQTRRHHLPPQPHLYQLRLQMSTVGEMAQGARQVLVSLRLGVYMGRQMVMCLG